MPRWMIKFTDTAEMLDVRKANRAAHIDYFKANRENLLLGGGLRDDLDGDFVGGMWIVEAAARAEVVTLIENDPYYRPEFRRYDIFALSKVLDEAVTL